MAGNKQDGSWNGKSEHGGASPGEMTWLRGLRPSFHFFFRLAFLLMKGCLF